MNRRSIAVLVLLAVASTALPQSAGQAILRTAAGDRQVATLRLGSETYFSVADVMGALGGVDLDSAPTGVDGCGLPTFGVPLSVLARMFAAATGDGGFRRCQEVMAAHPSLVAGRGRFDTALLAAAGHALTAKGGAAAVWVAVRRPSGPAMSSTSLARRSASHRVPGPLAANTNSTVPP